MPDIILKKSDTSGVVPLDTELSYGELALNYADGKLYYKNTSDEVKLIQPSEFASAVSITDPTSTLSDITGALKVTGGISTQENFYAGGSGKFDGPVTIFDTTQSTEDYSAAALLIKGGIGIEKDLHIKGDLHILGEGTLRFGPYDVGATAGNLWWVRNGGTDLDPNIVNGAGSQQWTAFATIKWALKYANFGDTVLVQPGEYEEIFPMYVPAGVSIRGSGLRETQIRPTVATNDLDAFLVSGDSTISDFTVKEFYYNSTNDTGYAFRFATYSATLTSGVATVTVSDTTGLVAGQAITKISGAGAFGASATVLSVQSATQFTASVDHATSGAIVFSVAKTLSRSTYVERCTVLCRGSVTSGTDPYGFAQGDAGRGVFIDGSLVNENSIEAAMLFNEMTFIQPNSRGIIMTNGARSEILNCFFYFCDLALEGVVGTAGSGMNGKTYLTIAGKTGTWANGNTVSLYDTDGTTVIASATIETVSGNLVTIDGSASGFIINTDRAAKIVELFGNSQLDTAVTKIGSASLLLDGTGDYLKVEGGTDFQFAGDFCAEAWIYPTDLTGSHYIFAFGTETLGRYVLFLDGNTIKGNYYGAISTTFGGTLSTNTWYHVALSRAGSTMTVYLDGTALGTTETNSNTLGNTGQLKIGADASASNVFAGHFDELRITKGFRRYSGTFTPYTTARIGDADTVLLLHFDGTDGATSIADDGNTEQDIRSSAGGTATEITRYDRKEFAAEVRAIACAFVYGNQGVKADGPDVSMQLMAHNFAYIGTGADVTNDKTSVVQANEVIEVNGGRVFFNSVDQSGNFRVGDSFVVDFETGAVSFSGGTFDVTALGSINFVDGANTTAIDAFGVTTGNISIAGNSITTTTGNLTLDPSGTISLVSDTTVTGAFTATGATALTAGTASSSTGTGTLVVTGGVGVSGTVYAGGFNGALTGTSSLATSLAGGAANRIAYQSAADTTAFVVAPTVGGTYLRWTGSAFDWIAPTFTAAGNNTEIQFNSSGSLGSSASFTYNSTTNVLALTGTDTEILLTGITNEPTAPAAEQLYLYSKNIGGRMMPKWVGPSGFDTAFQSWIASNKIAIWNAPAGGGTVPGVWGFNTMTASGTIQARTTTTTNLYTRARKVGYNSTNAAGNVAGNREPQANVTIGTGTIGVGGFHYVIRFGFSDNTGAATTASIRFVGLRNSTAAPVATDDPATFTQTIGIGARTGDTNFFVFYGGTAAQTPINLGANFPAKTANTDWYEFMLFAPSNSNNTVTYRLTRLNTGNVAEGTITAATPGLQLPSSTTLLAHRIYNSNNATAGTMQTDIGNIYLETDT